jgi:predicted glycosyltransferase
MVPTSPIADAVDTAPDLGGARLWVDLCSPSHPFLFRGVVDALDGVETRVTVREKTETVPLAESVGFDYRVVGRDFDNRLLRMAGIPLRTATLTYRMPACDAVLCSRNVMAILAAKARGVPSIHFTDNDITAHVDGLYAEHLYNRLEAEATHNVVPAAFDADALEGWNADADSVHTYDGIKEDIYVAGFEPDPTFPATLPFDSYVVVRPEALTAAYVDAERSLVPDLLAGLIDRDVRVVYLPRGRGDSDHADPFPGDHVYVPDGALDGLQLCWHADCVLTGSGTMVRESAAMGKPGVSFFPDQLLSVDERLVAEGRVFHSRDVSEILAYVEGLTESQTEPDRSRSVEVRREVAHLVADIVDDELPGGSSQ